MIPLLPKWHLMPNRPSFYDTDSKTLLELSGTLHAKMNELIEDYNNFVESVNNTITEFTHSTTHDQEIFKVAIRQEFQDFIDIVNVRMNAMQNQLNTLTENVEEITINTVNRAIASGQIVVGTEYNPETEEMNILANGGV